MAEFPCDTLPTELSPWWIKDGYGGISPCILGSPRPEYGATIANCVGWAWGRYCEIRGEAVPELPTGNGGTWFSTAIANGMETGTEPALGAVACFAGGPSGFGHVAIVEEIAEDGSYIRCSESDYGGPVFSYRTRYRSQNWSYPGYAQFQGFIYNEDVAENPFKWWLCARLLKRRKEEM